MSDTHQASQTLSPSSVAGQRIPPAVFLLTGAVAVIGSNSLVLSPIAPEVARSFGVSVPTVMSGTAAFGLGTAASALFLARHIDRIGAWRMLRIAFALLAASLLVSAAAPVALVLVAAQLGAGVAAGIALPAIYASAAAIAPPGRESTTVGIVLTGWTLSLVAGVSISAVLADWLDWRAVYGSVFLLAAGALAVLVFNKHRDKVSAEPAASPLAALAIVGVRPLLLACGAFMTAFYGVYAYLGDHLHSELSLPISANGLVTLAYGLGFGAAAFLDGLEKRVAPQMGLPLAFLAVALVYLLMAMENGAYGAILALAFLWGLANHLGLNLLIVRLTALEPARRGAIMGLNSAVTYLAVFAGPLGFGWLYTTAGFGALAGLAVVLMAVAILAAYAAPSKSKS
ncbi:MFS transporter [Chelativorans alearense]|uniref:MFS transporter n=1 Tax=Chelativorans alearense TaxID=2681495 RepID=UPI0013D06D9C|nr:MFS transporter [Chelativorans alearense]